MSDELENVLKLAEDKCREAEQELRIARKILRDKEREFKQAKRSVLLAKNLVEGRSPYLHASFPYGRGSFGSEEVYWLESPDYLIGRGAFVIALKNDEKTWKSVLYISKNFDGHLKIEKLQKLTTLPPSSELTIEQQDEIKHRQRELLIELENKTKTLRSTFDAIKKL